MKALFFLTLLCFLGNAVYSQQRPQLTQYIQNNYLVNPAVAGIEDYGDIRVGFRSQWLGIERAPTTLYVSMHAALNKSDKNVASLRHQSRSASSGISANRNNRFYRKPHHGVGAIAQVDQAGMIRASTLNLSYAYHLPVTPNATLSGGVNTGFTQMGVNRNLFLQTPNDPYLYEDLDNLFRMDLGVGLWLYSKDYFVGVSGTQLLGDNNRYYSTEDGPAALLQPHYYFTGGFRAYVSRDLALTPSFMVKASASGQTAVDVNLKALYAQRFWVGASYRHQDAVAFMLGLYLNHMLDVSYSYDTPVSELQSVNAYSHEIVVGVKFNNPYKILCPKYIW